jgi:rhodanese-related sulfurtransferase
MMSKQIIKTINCRELYELGLAGPIDLLDVRTPEEFSDIRAAHARNIPLDTLDPLAIVHTRTTPAEEPLYFICAVGARSAWACEMMMAAGYENVINVEGGTQASYLAGLPTERGG